MAARNYQPPPPPPDPLLDPGAVEADATLLASDAPTAPAKRLGFDQALLEPEYQPNVWSSRRDGSAEAAERTAANLSAQRFSTPSAIA